MKDSTITNTSTNTPRARGMLAAMWHWLTEPSASIDKEERRYQVRLLMTMLIGLIFLGLLVLSLSLLGFFSKVGDTEVKVIQFRWITVASVLLLAVVYSLSRTRYFSLATMLAVGSTLSETFVVVILESKDFYFLVLGGLIGSLFFSVGATVAIFVVTIVGLLILPIFDADLSIASAREGAFFILIIGVLVVLANTIRQRYLDQLHKSETLLRELSVRDPLTGFYNRRYMEEVLTLEIIRAIRKGYPVGIIMVDIDHFKRFNDRHGHAAGDAVLIQVCNLLRTCVRASDAACRYGGEEFIFILPEASQKITQMRAEQMREVTSHYHVQYEGQTLEAVTLSLGVATLPAAGVTKDAILGAVDTAMYRAKQDGRNRVAVAD